MVQFCPENPIVLHINHDGVDGALVALRIKTHGLDQRGAGLGSVVQQCAADLGADDGCEHRSVVWNKRSVRHRMGGCEPSRHNHSQSRIMLQKRPGPCVCSHQRSAASVMHAMGSSSKSSASTMHSTSSPPLGIQCRWSLGKKNAMNTSTARGLVVCWMNCMSLWW